MVEPEEINKAILEIRDLLRLLAAPAIAERDKKVREDIQRVVGQSEKKQTALMLMDGSKTQTEIHMATGFNKGHLSTMVKQLSEMGVLEEDTKKPKIKIYIPANFFQKD
jgi:hypothetical protein